ncbi:MAG: neutral/alkaline non-lysosomal ceramidase N-terminal domain-containing protein [Clostridia bacterium]|nr:neutral/alkaline non-lysosomal ceramidase N-terminal domain-containing protein [Clostridia bacterium]
MKDLFMGAAREIITPKVGALLYGYVPGLHSTKVADDLTATAFYFRQGEKEALMISLAVCQINTALSDRIRDLIEEKFNIPKENCILAAFHTHSGPNVAGTEGWGDIDRDYCDEIFIPGIIRATEAAVKKAERVRAGVSKGESFVGINRRELKNDNKIHLGQNPRGCFNPRMTVMSFINDEDKVVGNIIHYGAHCTAAGRNTEISRDWAGIMTDALEKENGGITAFFNGAEGDVGPRLSNGDTTGDMSYVKEIGEIAACDAVRIFKEIKGFYPAELKASQAVIEILLKKRLSKEAAKEMYEVYKNQTVNVWGMTRVHLEKVIASYEEGYEDKESIGILQVVIGIGNVFFASTPFEPFSEIELRADKMAEDAEVLMLSNANGSEGYFITEDALCRGGYEVNMWLYKDIQPYSDDADWHLAMSTAEHIKKVREC